MKERQNGFVTKVAPGGEVLPDWEKTNHHELSPGESFLSHDDYAQTMVGYEEDDILTYYFHEVGEFKLLTAEEELDLAKTIEKGKLARTRLLNKELPRSERERLERDSKEAETARAQFISANTRLVVAWAKRYRGNGVPFSDLVQEGNLGLMIAVDKYDYRRGKFSTYASCWIRQRISRSLGNQGRMIPLPTDKIDLLRKVKKTGQEQSQASGSYPDTYAIAYDICEKDLERQLGRTPFPEEVERYLEKSHTLEKVTQLLELDQEEVNLDANPRETDDGGFSGDMSEKLESDNLEGKPETVAVQNVFREQILKLISTLDERESKIILARFGFVDGSDKTLKEVGEEIGLTRERVRQLQHETIEKLRNHPDWQKLFEELQ